MSATHARRAEDDPPEPIAVPLDDDPSAVPAARRAVEAALRRHLVPAELVDVVLLVTSELVTNAVEHGGGAEHLELEWQPDSVLLRVRDRGAGRPRSQTAAPRSERGRGLPLVEAFASEWGWESHDHGKSVWSRFSLTDG